MTEPAPLARWGRVRVIFNAGAGRKAGVPITTATRDEVLAIMTEVGLGADLREVETGEEARAEASDAVREGCQLVVAAGGDGTIGAVAGALLGTPVTLAILPLGSVMNVPRSLGLPRDLRAAADALRNGEMRRIDVGVARDEPFFEAGSVGMNAAMFREAERVDAGDWLAIARTIWIAIRYRPARMELELDDRSIRMRALMVAVANGPYTGVGLTVAPEARLDDGLFDVVVFRRFSKVQLLRHLVSIAFGRRRYTPEVEVFRSSHVVVRSRRPLPCRADSRDLGTTPVSFAIRPGALRVMVPAGAVDAAMD